MSGTNYQALLDEVARALHPHWPKDARKTYSPEDLPKMIKLLQSQLHACSFAAIDGTQGIPKDSEHWGPDYQLVRDLRVKYDDLCRDVVQKVKALADPLENVTYDVAIQAAVAVVEAAVRGAGETPSCSLCGGSGYLHEQPLRCGSRCVRFADEIAQSKRDILHSSEGIFVERVDVIDALLKQGVIVETGERAVVLGVESHVYERSDGSKDHHIYSDVKPGCLRCECVKDNPTPWMIYSQSSAFADEVAGKDESKL